MNESLRLGILIGLIFGSVIWGVVFAVCFTARKQDQRKHVQVGHPAFFKSQVIR